MPNPVLGPTTVDRDGSLVWFTGYPFDGYVSSPFDPQRPSFMTPTGPTPVGHFAADMVPSVWPVKGTPIFALCDFTVTHSGQPVDGGMDLAGGHGMFGRIDDEWGIGFWHMEGLQLDVGHKVKRGDIIGQVGTSGLSTGDHLHFMLLKADVRPGVTWYPPAAFVDPILYFAADVSVPAPAPAPSVLYGEWPQPGTGALLVVTEDVYDTVLALAAADHGVKSLWVVEGGIWRGHLVGAPARVNAGFPDLLVSGTAVYVQA